MLWIDRARFSTSRHAYLAGQHAYLAGQHAYLAGQHAYLAGQHAYLAGKHTYLTGKHGCLAGEHTCLGGKHGYVGGEGGVGRVRGMEIWVNPACSKCRSAVSMLNDAGAQYTVRRYLDEPPTVAELEAVLDRLGLQPWEITRTAEPIAKELGLKTWPKDEANRERWVAALADHPKLIQRPIITADDGRTVVARTPEAVQSALP